MLESLLNCETFCIKRRLQHRFFPVIFCEIFVNTYFVEYPQRLLLPIAASAVENILTFNIAILVAFAKLPKKITNCSCILHRVRQLNVINLTYFFITLCVYSVLFCSPSIFLLLYIKYMLPKTFFQRNFLVL